MVGQAISAAIAASNGSPVTRRHYACFADLFLEWLGDKYPRVKTWDAMATEAVRDYQTHCQRELGLADDTVKRRMLPVKMASRYWHENDPERYQDVARAVHFHCSASNPLENERRERAKALSASDLAALLTYLHTREPVLHGPVLLQSLCGLRVLEALNLRRQSILRRAPSQSLKQNGTARRTGSAFAFCL
jgi:integrase